MAAGGAGGKPLLLMLVLPPPCRLLLSPAVAPLSGRGKGRQPPPSSPPLAASSLASSMTVGSRGRTPLDGTLLCFLVDGTNIVPILYRRDPPRQQQNSLRLPHYLKTTTGPRGAHT
ncbi:unnamed protein product, partial [Ectocarpus sp. 12 AP-2014]